MDPSTADTDGDGRTDGEEVGALVAGEEAILDYGHAFETVGASPDADFMYQQFATILQRSTPTVTT